jgi:hypothetical protein
MRAAEIVQTRSLTERRRMASLLDAGGSDPESLIQAMRSPRTARCVENHCTTPQMREDVWLIAANPFDAILPDEVVDAEWLQAIGLIERRGRSFVPNIDFALTLVPLSPIEFGFCATLLTRMRSDELARLGRVVDVGPRASMIDYILDIATQCVTEEPAMRRLAHLRISDRQELMDTLALGDLPDSMEGLQNVVDRPQVHLGPGEAGHRGLLFVVDHPARGLHSRAVVPLELVSVLPDLLERVPAAPETEVRRVPTRRKRTRVSDPVGRTQGVHRVPLTLATDPLPLPIALPLGQAVRNTPTGDGPAQPLEEAAPTEVVAHRASVTTVHAGALQRKVQGRPAAGVVDLEKPQFAQAAQADDVLRVSILEVVADNLVVLRPGTDVGEWAERAAERLVFR